jgi:hypothetical protein
MPLILTRISSIVINTQHNHNILKAVSFRNVVIVLRVGDDGKKILVNISGIV